MIRFERLQETVKVQAYTLEAVAKHATTEEELLRGVRDVMAALESGVCWPVEAGS
jgi:hypothetical protein